MQHILKAIDNNIDKADEGKNEIWHLTRACSGLAMIVKTQQAEIDALKHQVSEIAALRMDISVLKAQVVRLVDATPSAGVVEEK